MDRKPISSHFLKVFLLTVFGLATLGNSGCTNHYMSTAFEEEYIDSGRVGSYDPAFAPVTIPDQN